MSRNALELLRQLGDVESGPGLDARARADFARIVAEPRTPGADAPQPPRRRLRPSRLPLAVASVLVLALLALTGIGWGHGLFGDGRAYAATPPRLQSRPAVDLARYGLDLRTDSGPVPAATVLRQLADRVQLLPDDTGTGPVAKVVTQSWQIPAIGEGVEHYEVVPVHTTTWTAQDGSGRIVRSTDGHTSTLTFGPHQMGMTWPLHSLSADPAQLAEQLQRDHPRENGPAERLVAITDLYREQPAPPKVRAQILRYLADTPGLATTGAVTDRLGRLRLAVHLDHNMFGLPTRTTLIIDPKTGTLLGTQDVLTKTPGKLRVRIPAVIEYTAFKSAHFQGSTN